METIMKFLGFFIGLFVIVNGIWVFAMPPTGDEPQGLAIIAIGVFIPAIIFYVARIDERREAESRMILPGSDNVIVIIPDQFPEFRIFSGRHPPGFQ
jgi:hypothetical protein